MIPDLMRLHITPFSPDYLKAVVGPHLLDSVSNISYHTVQTFPENNYGYLEIPRMEGEKLKKKLNGAILKGKKMKIEEARPNKRRRTEEPQEDVSSEKPTAGTAKKSKKERNVVAGHELPADRKVKRGWTEAKPPKADKKDKAKITSSKSKYSDKDELLFRANVPLNRLGGPDTAQKEKSKSRKTKGERTVHEFEKSTKQPSFLKQDTKLGIKGNLEYVEGQGWVDEAGEVVEKETGGITKRRDEATSRPRLKRKLVIETARALSDDDDDGEPEEQPEEQPAAPEVGPVDETSSSGSPSASDSDDDTDDSVRSPDSTSDKPEDSDMSEVHPLEALFKKPHKPTSQDIAKPSLEISTAFSFFDAENADDLDDEPIVPLTPFSSQEFRSRGLRSAAPTPDTAYPSRFNSYGSSGLPGDEDAEEDNGRRSDAPPSKKPAETSSLSQTDFEKKFWENRAENNRAWKLRRRTVLKEKRQRDNKARRPKSW